MMPHRGGPRALHTAHMQLPMSIIVIAKHTLPNYALGLSVSTIWRQLNQCYANPTSCSTTIEPAWIIVRVPELASSTLFGVGDISRCTVPFRLLGMCVAWVVDPWPLSTLGVRSVGHIDDQTIHLRTIQCNVAIDDDDLAIGHHVEVTSVLTDRRLDCLLPIARCRC